MSARVWVPRDRLEEDINYNYHHYHYSHPDQVMEPGVVGVGAIATATTSGPNATNGTSGGVVVRGEEVGIVLVVLILWVGAIALFFHRWGKIRMLEPYQPKFCAQHTPNCPMADVPPITTTYPLISQRTFSKFNLASETGGSPHFSKCKYHGVTTAVTCGQGEPLLNGGNMNMNGSGASPLVGMRPSGSRSMSISMGGLGVPSGQLGGSYSPRIGGSARGGINSSRLRQNSVFVTSPNFPPSNVFGENGVLGKSSGRKTKSAVDLSTIVLCGELMENVRRNSKNSVTNL